MTSGTATLTNIYALINGAPVGSYVYIYYSSKTAVLMRFPTDVYLTHYIDGTGGVGGYFYIRDVEIRRAYLSSPSGTTAKIVTGDLAISSSNSCEYILYTRDV